MSNPGKSSWQLLAPDWAALDTIWRNPMPFVLWPVGNQPLLAHWMDEAVRQGIDAVEIFVPDRPADVRLWLEGGAYWSRKVKITPIGKESDAPAEAQRVDRLPGDPAMGQVPADARALLGHWFDMQRHWLQHRMEMSPSVEELHESGGWVGAQALVAASAQLVPPFWIGSDARVGEGCRIGPNAFIGRHAIIDNEVEVENAFVGPGTYVGSFTRISRAIASGRTLVDMARGVRLELAERFILSSVDERNSRPGVGERLAALACSALLAPAAALLNRGAWTERRVTACEDDTIQLRTGRRGPLWLRRWPWLGHIAAGRLRWIGALPRGEEDFQRMPEELAKPVRAARAGMFSLADLHGCSSVEDAEEWIHASYQVQAVDPTISRPLKKNLWKLAWSQPTPTPNATPQPATSR